MKLTTERLRELIKEEMQKVLQENPLAGNNKTAAPDPFGGDKGTAAPDGKGGYNFPNKGKKKQSNPLSGNNKTAASPIDPSDPNNPNNPLGGKNETATPDNPKGAPINDRVSKLEQVVKELISFIQKSKS